MRRQWLWGLALCLLASCGSPTSGPASGLLRLLVGSAGPAQEPMNVLALLDYSSPDPTCPPLGITASLDGGTLSGSETSSPLGAGQCRVTFFAAPVPPPADQSVLRLNSDSFEAVLVTRNLLAPRQWTTTLPDGAIVEQGDSATFTWSTDGDTLTDVAASFNDETVQMPVTPHLSGKMATVTVPVLASGQWILAMSANALPGVVSCQGVARCLPLISRIDSVPISAP